MNILNAIGSGLRNVGEGIGTGALAAGKGLADYLNAQAMRQSGLTPEQLQQNPQLARSAMGNWLGSIGQGMQTGDYTGSRLGYQQEMLTKLQNLQAMKQQDAAKQRQAAFQEAASQVDLADPSQVNQLTRAFPEYAEQIGKMLQPSNTIAETESRNASAYKNRVDAYLSQLPKPPEVLKYEEGISPDGQSMVIYRFFKDGRDPEPTSVAVPEWVGQGGGYMTNKRTGEQMGPSPKEETTSRLIEAKALQASEPQRFPTLSSAISFLNPKPQGGSGGGASNKEARTMPQMQFRDFKTRFDMLASLADLAVTLNDGYFGHTATGGGSTYGQSLGLPDFISQAAPGQAQWWSQFASLDNDIRHGKFGAALTASELKSYSRETVTERTSPDEARRILGNKLGVLGKSLEREYGSSIAAYNKDQLSPYNPAEILAPIRGFIESSQKAQQPQQSQRVTGVNSVAPNQGGMTTVSNAAQYNALPSGAVFIDGRDGQRKRKP